MDSSLFTVAAFSAFVAALAILGAIATAYGAESRQGFTPYSD